MARQAVARRRFRLIGEPDLVPLAAPPKAPIILVAVDLAQESEAL